MKKKVLAIVIMFLCSMITVPCMAGVDVQDILINEPDSTYLDSLRKARIKEQQESFEHFYEVKREEEAPHVPEYIETLSDTNAHRRQIAAMNLGLTQDLSVVPYLEQLLREDPSGKVRVECAGSLGWLKSYSSQPVLIEALKDSVKGVSLEAALALASLGDTTYCLPVLEQFMETKRWKTRLETIHGFADIGTERAIQDLRNAMNDENLHVAATAAAILSELGYGEYAFSYLKEMLMSDDRQIRCGAIRGLAEIGNAKSLRLIIGMLNDKSPFVRQYARGLLQSYFNIKIQEPKDESSMRNYDPDEAAAYNDK